jgi:hypothetical protein
VKCLEDGRFHVAQVADAKSQSRQSAITVDEVKTHAFDTVAGAQMW